MKEFTRNEIVRLHYGGASHAALRACWALLERAWPKHWRRTRIAARAPRKSSARRGPACWTRLRIRSRNWWIATPSHCGAAA